MKLKLTGQRMVHGAAARAWDQLRTELEKRLTVWRALPPIKRRQWLKNAAARDPVLHLARRIYLYLRMWFGDLNDDQ